MRAVGLALTGENGVYSLACTASQPGIFAPFSLRPLLLSLVPQIGYRSPMSVKQKRNSRKPRSQRSQKARGRQSPKSSHQQSPEASLWLYGRHAVAAALKNENRPLRRVIATKNALEWLRAENAPAAILNKIAIATAEEIDGYLQKGAVHQGVAAEVDDLPRARLKSVCADPRPEAPVVVLDQITDPQNIGAIFRSAAAFGARAIIVQDRRTPALAGALAKAAAGAVETLPCVSVVNISRTIEALQGLGFYCAGLAGEAEDSIRALPRQTPVALVMGAEGDGLRKLVGETCDGLYKIPMAPGVESLNVSNAAAIALYETIFSDHE